MSTAGRAAPLSPEQRREALISSTLPLLREHGASITTRQIAQACGIAEGTIFRAFPDKQSLISAAIDKALDPSEMIDDIGRIDRGLPLEDRLIAAGSILTERLTGVVTVLSAMRVAPQAGFPAGNCGPRHEHRRARHAAIVGAVADLLEADRHRLRRTPVEVAELLYALIFAGAHPLTSADSPMSVDEIVSILLDGVRC